MVTPEHFPKTGYYAFKIKHSGLKDDNPPQFEFLVDNRIIGTTYFSDEPLSSEISAFVSHGKHKLEIRTMFETMSSIDYDVKISPTNRAVEEPIFSFVTLTDSHILQKAPHPPRGGKIHMGEGTIPLYDHDVPSFPHLMNWINHLLFEETPGIMDEVTNKSNALNPDFVIHTGDIGGEKREYLEAGKHFLDKLNCPYYIARGNHDNRDEMLNVFDDIAGDKTYYSFNHKGYHFIILDSSYFLLRDKILPWPGETFNGSELKGLIIPEEELKWVEDDLKRYGEMKTFVFTHSALAVSGKGPYPNYSQPLYNHKEVFRMFDQYKNIKAIFAGHSHINDLEIRNNVYHFQTSSLIEYPMCYRQVVMFPSHVEIWTRQVNREFLEKSFLRTPENIFNKAPNVWVVGRNDNLYAEIE